MSLRQKLIDILWPDAAERNRIRGEGRPVPELPKMIRPRGPEIKERSDKNGDRLTKDETAWVEWAYNAERPDMACPDCCEGTLLGGPCGGGAQNCMCSKCYSEFNILFFPNVIERISDPGERTERARQLYGQ